MPAFEAPAELRGVFVGSGSDGLNEPEITKSILSLVDKEPSSTTVLYLGTATYDLPGPRERQTNRLRESGCKIVPLDVVDSAPSFAEMEEALSEADVVVVSGGNTLFAVDRWKRLGLDSLLERAMRKGTVLAGGSAGAICWFQGGHSDSMDPDSYKRKMLASADTGADESSAAPEADEQAKAWEYIRIPGLGFLPGLCCPHHDKVQSNGVLRADDFDGMLLRHPCELGVCIDHWAALELVGKRFRVLSLEGKEGSVLADGSFSRERKGRPGVWLKEAKGKEVLMRPCPDEGDLAELLKVPDEIVEDPRVVRCRAENPDDGPLHTSASE